MATGRPKLDCLVEVINLRLSLRVGVDDDLIEFFTGIPPRQKAGTVKAALRAGGMTIEVEKDGKFNTSEAEMLMGAFDEMEW